MKKKRKEKTSDCKEINESFSSKIVLSFLFFFLSSFDKRSLLCDQGCASTSDLKGQERHMEPNHLETVGNQQREQSEFELSPPLKGGAWFWPKNAGGVRGNMPNFPSKEKIVGLRVFLRISCTMHVHTSIPLCVHIHTRVNLL